MDSGVPGGNSSSQKDKILVHSVRSKALSFLARSSHSTKSLKLKLLKREFNSEIINEVIEELTDNGYLNDRQYALEWLNSRMYKHPEGKQLLFAGLVKRGISREIAAEAIAVAITPETEYECVRSLVEKFRRKPGLSDSELTVKLYARRFDRRIIREIMSLNPEL